MLYPAPGPDSKRIPHRPTGGSPSGRRARMCRFRKDARISRGSVAGNATSRSGERSRFAKARAIEQQERNDGHTKTQTDNHHRPKKGISQKRIAARKRRISRVGALHRLLHRGQKTRIQKRQKTVCKKDQLKEENGIQRPRFELEDPHSSDAKYEAHNPKD